MVSLGIGRSRGWCWKFRGWSSCVIRRNALAKASHDCRDRQPNSLAVQREARLFSESAAIRRLSSWLRSPSSTPYFGSS
jgi:hypothetical protein